MPTTNHDAPPHAHAPPTDAATPAPDAAIEIRALRRVYPAPRRRRAHANNKPTERVALDGIDLTIPRGSMVALLGPNGSGKSTLLRILATADTPDHGSCRLLGIDTREHRRDVRARLGVVFQSPSLDGLLTVRENLRIHASIAGMSRAEGDASADRLMKRLRVADRAGDRVSTLSGGLARRVDLARALLNAPELLLLDEPTSSLDPRAAGEFIDLLRALVDEPDTGETAHAAPPPTPTILIATHALDVGERADRVVMIHEGRIVADAPPGDLRRELGELRISVPTARLTDSVRTAWRDAGLSMDEQNDALHATLDADAAGLLTTLARERVGFEVGPPTLEDVFFARTGATLRHAPADEGNGA